MDGTKPCEHPVAYPSLLMCNGHAMRFYRYGDTFDERPILGKHGRGGRKLHAQFPNSMTDKVKNREESWFF